MYISKIIAVLFIAAVTAVNLVVVLLVLCQAMNTPLVKAVGHVNPLCHEFSWPWATPVALSVKSAQTECMFLAYQHNYVFNVTFSNNTPVALGRP
jgi:hypothetical protein